MLEHLEDEQSIKSKLFGDMH